MISHYHLDKQGVLLLIARDNGFCPSLPWLFVMQLGVQVLILWNRDVQVKIQQTIMHHHYSLHCI